ncbi:NucA/NucB deoxyribonuclease domain-containing protein [Micromonospora saelicesensis]|uniref:NucA/NucB deoxyribonuclease domain-containing protein n=1 Tax=Micromonospora saelicesensis TaxID=285676 RepID=UPI0011BDFA1A|nr:hypothetical protein [Micromonospora saelicesensis]
MAALLGVPGPAQAAPEQAAPAAAPDNAAGQITHTLTPKTPDPPPATRAAPADDVLTLRTELYERARLLANPSTAPFDTAACQDQVLSSRREGFVISHFRYCSTTEWEADSYVCQLGVGSVCLYKKKIGHAEFRVTLAGHGWDATLPADGANPALNQINWTMTVDKWEDTWGEALLVPLKIGVECVQNTVTAPCIADPSRGEANRPIGQWMLQGNHSFRWMEEPLDGNGHDFIAYFGFHAYLQYGNDPQSTTAHNTFRCDNTVYLRGDRGCVFDSMASVFDKLRIGNDSNNMQEALHVYDAFNFPQNTVPADPDKKVPGNPDADGYPEPLTRAYELFNPLLVANNHETAVATCVQAALPSTDYTQGETLDCDEYPFKSTYQGASVAGTNYSARAILLGHNRSGGASLGNWYKSERILDGDKFYVKIRVGEGTGGGGGGSPIVDDQAPRVSAGADTSGSEGGRVLLTGSASDYEGTPATAWTYTAGPDVDPGARCTFTSTGTPATAMTCTDDGTFTVTLTADDGVNPAVSDSATVRVRNVAPQLTLGDPDAAAAEAGLAPWSVHRVGTAVSGGVSFRDPGSNDTHTCTLTWDDGTTTRTPASNGVCTGQHSPTRPGMYTIGITVTDDDAAASDPASTMIVVYDPDGGFSTAGARVASPQGALSSDPSRTGTLSVQMNPKYKPGESGPAPGDGKVNASLSAGGLNFASTSMEWLVVTPDNKVAVKGTGTVNGVAGYGFVAYGYDDPDALRLVVWRLADSPHPRENPLYDSRRDGDYDLDRAGPLPLVGGSVQVHL